MAPSRDEKSVIRNERSAADDAILPCLRSAKRQRSNGKNLIVLPSFIEQYISTSRFDCGTQLIDLGVRFPRHRPA